MEYVVYLSKTKIDMLYNQVGKNPFEYSIGGQVDFGAVKIDANKKGSSQKDYFQKLEQVISEISKVNSIYEEDAQYITGTMPMYWGMLKYTYTATFWVGQESNGICHSRILLIGSSQHIIGNNPNGEGIHCSPLACFLHAYHKELEFNKPLEQVAKQYNKSDIEYIVPSLQSYCDLDRLQVLSQYKFLAKCLSQSYHVYNDGSIENLIIATPLYVSNI